MRPVSISTIHDGREPNGLFQTPIMPNGGSSFHYHGRAGFQILKRYDGKEINIYRAKGPQKPVYGGLNPPLTSRYYCSFAVQRT